MASSPARRIGASAIRIFTGNHRSADATDEQWTRAAACLRELCDAAADPQGDRRGGIVLAAELHDWNLMDTVDGAERLHALVDRANFGFIFHPSRWPADPLTPLRRLRAHVRHVHATNPGGTLESGAIDYRAVVGGLRAIGFAGFVSVEHFGPGGEECARREGPFLRRLLSTV